MEKVDRVLVLEPGAVVPLDISLSEGKDEDVVAEFGGEAKERRVCVALGTVVFCQSPLLRLICGELTSRPG